MDRRSSIATTIRASRLSAIKVALLRMDSTMEPPPRRTYVIAFIARFICPAVRVGSSHSRLAGNSRLPRNPTAARITVAAAIVNAPTFARLATLPSGAATAGHSHPSRSCRHSTNTRLSQRSASTISQQAAQVCRCLATTLASASVNSPSAYTEHVNSSRQATSFLLLQFLPQLLLASENQCRHVIPRQTQRPGNLVVAQFVEVCQHQRHTVLLLKLRQGRADIVAPLCGQQLTQRTRARRPRFRRIGTLQLEQASFRSAPPQQVDAVIAGNAQEPAREGKRRVVALQPALRAQKYLMRRILGRVKRIQQVPAQVEDAAVVRFIDVGKVLVLRRLRLHRSVHVVTILLL